MLAARLTAARAHAETLPGASIVRSAFEQERDLGGGLIAGGVAFRVFLWLVPFGLVVAALLSFWSEHDPDGLEEASREFGVGAAAASAAAEALQNGDRSALIVLLFGLVLLAWFTLGALRALILAHALAWQLTPPRIRRPLTAIAAFNGLLVLHWLLAAGLAWLRDQVGVLALLSLAIGLALSTAIAAYAMWLLPNRATHPRELLPGALLVAFGVQLIQVAVHLLLRAQARAVGGDVRRLRRGGDDPRLALRDQPPDHERRIPERDAVVAASAAEPDEGHAHPPDAARRRRLFERPWQGRASRVARGTRSVGLGRAEPGRSASDVLRGRAPHRT